MPASSQLRLHLAELRAHTVAAGLPLEQEAPPSAPTADEREAQKGKGLRFSEPALRASGRGKATELDQAGLGRMKRQRELPEPCPHRLPEAPRVGFVLEAHDEIVGIPRDDH